MTKKQIKQHYSNCYDNEIQQETQWHKIKGGIEYTPYQTENCKDKDFITELGHRLDSYYILGDRDWIENDKEAKQFKEWYKVFTGKKYNKELQND